MHIHNNNGSKVTAEKSEGPDGRLRIDVMVDAVEQAMATRLSRPGTTLNRALATAVNPVRAR